MKFTKSTIPENRIGVKKTRERGRQSQPGYKNEEVAPIVEEVLRIQDPLREGEIREKIGEKAQEAGRSRVGLHLRVKEVLKDDRFKSSGGKYQLA